GEPLRRRASGLRSQCANPSAGPGGHRVDGRLAPAAWRRRSLPRGAREHVFHGAPADRPRWAEVAAGGAGMKRETRVTDDLLWGLARRVGRRLRAARLSIATAESCTGGLIAKALTDIARSSDYFERGWVTYSN